MRLANNHSLARLTVLFLVLASVISVPSRPGQKQGSGMKVILDTDIGDDIDDAWALAFVIVHAGFEPLGVTVTHGNTPARAKIACKLLHVSGRGQIPVFVGRKTNDKVFQQYSWAEDFTARRPSTRHAADFIVDSVKRYPGQVTVVAVGPLQNLADALRKEPNLGRYVKRVVLMSGCVYGTTYGPGKPIAEWNVRQSIADAQLVYGAGLPLTIVPLDSTTLVQLKEDERKRVADRQSSLTYSLESLYRLWLASPAQRMTLHDQLAVAETALPGAFFAKRDTLPLKVDDEGYTRIDRERGKPVTVCLQPKRDDFMEYYIGQLTGQRLGK
jgi:inosine-uridine nucleoside N-ribohydrolase